MGGRAGRRLVFVHLSDTEATRMLKPLLLAVGAARLAELFAETVHTHADHLAMSGRTDETFRLRRYAQVIIKAALDLRAAR